MADGLGGQMSRYALGRYLAVKNNTDLLLDLSFYKSKHNFAECDTRFFSLNQFQINAQIASQPQIKKLKTNRYLKKLGFVKRGHIINEFDDIALDNFRPVGDCYIESGAGALRPWTEIRQTLLKEFSLKEEFALDNQLVKSFSNKTVAMHFRRGDKANNPIVNKVHGVCSNEYYQQALDYLNKKLGDFELLIFSDEPEWVKDNLKFSQPFRYAKEYQLSDNQEMILMSRCAHQITANSGFSLWAAWLNNNENKIVIIPKKMVNIEELESDNNIPAGWIRL